MNLHSSEVENIVRAVVAELRQRTADDVASVAVAPTSQASILRVDQSPVTLVVLDGQLEGVHEVQVARRAVVTPAVLDHLREREIKLTRVVGEQVSAAVPDTGQRILFIDEAVEGLSANANIDRKQATTSCEADIGRIAASVRQGGRIALWRTSRPYAVQIATCQSSILKAVLLPDASELQRVLQEAEVNLLLLDSLRWDNQKLGGLLTQLSQPSALTGGRR